MIGKTISHYKILEKLGGGGMGVVYKATDTKLDRFVALKFLPPTFSYDEESKQRFIHEAKSASALDHPNICAIHEISETDDEPTTAGGQLFIVMSYYEGETLKKKIEQGPLKIEEAIDITIQIAKGLEKAHEKEIVHRDIKPPNIFITNDGTVKILDFGLAKSASRDTMTQLGSTMGTAAYMSPEQTQGEDVTHRTDIWSLGVVLYEMLTGKLPFRGDYEQAVSYSIMNESQDPLTGLRTGVPIELERIVNKTLEKKPDERYQHVDELIVDLKAVIKTIEISELQTSSISKAKIVTTPTQPEKIASSRKKWLFGLAAVLLIVATIVIYFIGGDSNDVIEVERKMLAVLPFKNKELVAKHTQISFTGTASNPRISPDGLSLAYIENSNGKIFVNVRDLSGGNPIQIWEGYMVSELEWFPDGKKLLITGMDGEDRRWNYIVFRYGGNERKFECHLHNSISPDGSTIASTFMSGKRIYFMNLISQDTSSIPIRNEFTWIDGIKWSSQGDRLLLLVTEGIKKSFLSIAKDGRDEKILFSEEAEIGSFRFFHDENTLYFNQQDNGNSSSIVKLQLNETCTSIIDPPKVVLSGLKMKAELFTNFSISNDKKLVYTQSFTYSNLWLGKLAKDKVKTNFIDKQLTTGTASIRFPSISPTGIEISFQMNNNIFLMSLDDMQMTQLTFKNQDIYRTVWSSDSKFLAYGTGVNEKINVCVIPKKGGQVKVFEKTYLSGNFSLAWAPGKNILYQIPGNINYNILDIKTETKNKLVPDYNGSFMESPQWSNDGNKIALYCGRKYSTSWQTGIWIISIVDSTETLLTNTETLYPLKWSSDDKYLYVFNDDTKHHSIQKILVSEQRIVESFLLNNRNFMYWHISIDPNEKEYVYVKQEHKTDIWIIENFE